MACKLRKHWISLLLCTRGSQFTFCQEEQHSQKCSFMLGLILVHTWRLHSSDFHSEGDLYGLLGHLALSLKKKKSPIHLKIGHPEMIAFKIYGKFIFLFCQLVIRSVKPSWLLPQFQLALKCCTAVSGRNLKSMLYGNANAWGTRHSVMIQVWICSGQKGKYCKIHFEDFNEFLPSTFMILVTSLRSYCTWLVK